MSLFNPTLEEYRNAVEWHAKNRIDNMLHNKGNEHALVIFENMFKYSTDHVRIFAKDLANMEVVNTKRYVESIKEFISRPGVKLDILVTDFNEEVKDIDKDVNLFYMLRSSWAYSANRIRIRTTNGMTFRMQGNAIHFCTSDGHAYRLERDIDKRIAQANFGDAKTTEKLDSLFDDAFEKCVNKVRLEDYFA